MKLGCYHALRRHKQEPRHGTNKFVLVASPGRGALLSRPKEVRNCYPPPKRRVVARTGRAGTVVRRVTRAVIGAPLRYPASPSTNKGSRVVRQIPSHRAAHQRSLRETPGGSAGPIGGSGSACQLGSESAIGIDGSIFRTIDPKFVFAIRISFWQSEIHDRRSRIRNPRFENQLQRFEMSDR